MNKVNFIKQMNNGQLVLICDNIPESEFINANKVRNIYKAKILDKTSKIGEASGGPDVELTDLSGKQLKIRREQLIANYIYANGHKIKMYLLKNNKDYIVTNLCNTECKVLRIPDNCIGSINEKKVASGSYIVYENSESGLNKENIYIISGKAFKKCFKIPMQEALSKNKKKVKKEIEQQNKRITLNKPTEQKIDLTKNNPVNINKNMEQKKYKFKAVARVVGMNKKLLGFIVIDAEGNKHQLTIAQLSKLCEQKLVENIMIVTKESTGIKFLKGNGIRIESLPEVLA